MLQTTISGHRSSPIGEVVWIAAGIIVVMAFGDVLVVSALALTVAAMAAAWWLHHVASQREQRTDAPLASVTKLRGGLMHQTPADVRGPRAA